jgi:hypothetical protein
MRDNDLRYFPDDDDDHRMRSYRRARDSYEFSLEPRHMALIVMVGLICLAFMFATGYITGRSMALREGGVIAKEGDGGDEKGTSLFGIDGEGTEGEGVTEGKKPEVNFYDELGSGEITEERLGDGDGGVSGDGAKDVTLPKGDSPEGKDDVAKTTTGDGKMYYIRVFATNDKVKADKILKSLKADGYPAYTKELQGGTIRIGIKWYKTKEEALKVMGDLMMDKNYKDFTPELGVGWE